MQAASKGLMLVTFLLGIFMGALDHGIVGPALSSIFQAFDVDSSWGGWSMTIYTLTFAVSIPVLGKLSDRFGRKRTFMFGISMFALGSIVCAFAPNFAVFLAGRAIQGIGTGGIFPITAAQIAVSYPPEQRGAKLGLIGVVFGTGSILGPIVGGAIIKYLEWEWIFLVNIPISIVILILISRIKLEQQVQVKPIDYKGISLLAVVILAIMYGITSGQWLIAVIGLAAIPLLVMVEKRQADPIVNLSYFQRRPTLLLLIVTFLSGAIMTTSFFIPVFSEKVLQMAKGDSGFTVAPFAVASALASYFGGVLADKLGARRIMAIGFVIAAAGAIALGMIGEEPAVFYAATTVMGFGVGIIIGAPINVLMLQAVELKDAGSAIGYLSLLRSMGSSLGPVIAGKLLATYSDGFPYVFGFSSVLAFISLILLFMSIPAAKAVAASKTA
ncbi:MFS transporter [Paenibacillus sp. NEAU-GSW1]|uniref:MFS transporter n=1 Tax=Paenibacillus sp. NEAU-GSW1 TaxID=2682486 RepID=UPI0012E1CCB9|nr:MFS transporter [Paenibacillus sp. NEAU-GSW1]MUT66484.1 MFS transporter [Paenibacillus sp. NEAU-GSW1]